MCNLNIYVVEDDPFIALTLKQMIVKLGHRVCGCTDTCEQAITELPRLKPDLVITDIMLNGPGTGIDLGRYLNQHLHIPFIYQSSVQNRDLIDAAEATRPEAYFTKPVKRHQLQQVIAPCPAY